MGEPDGPVTMDQLRPGESGIAEALLPDAAAALSRLGLVPGTEVRCLRRSPLGDPSVYALRGTVLAIRRRDAEKILVRTAGGAMRGK